MEIENRETFEITMMTLVNCMSENERNFTVVAR